ncbi:cyclase family protein [Streptococcus gallolyticus subsp. gallolyticus]|uniref:cyclase family protein n=1 Tax=Streptococcus gallolyticus TaxID=315405 RepID=UPI002283C3C7|nr:cyclase family protein [Streptococcus gallolyticus]MCY7172665.1 cyclase family protein [Streptococcus gallolyticus subsp. gallolyticus]
MKLIDLSVMLDENDKSEEIKTKIKYIPHNRGAFLLGLSLMFKRNQSNFKKVIQVILNLCRGNFLNKHSFLNHSGLSTEFLSLSSHSGTHIDSPYHYSEFGKKISDSELDIFYNKGILLDFSTRELSTPVRLEELKKYLLLNDISLSPCNIVLIHTGASRNYGTERYRSEYFGVEEKVIEFLLKSGIKVIGTDAFSLDQPFDYMEKKYMESNDSHELWPIHMLGSKYNFYMIEKLYNLDKLRGIKEFDVIAFPIKIKGASAAWSRVVAVVR